MFFSNISIKTSFGDVAEDALTCRKISAIATNFGSASIEFTSRRISEYDWSDCRRNFVRDEFKSAVNFLNSLLVFCQPTGIASRLIAISFCNSEILDWILFLLLTLVSFRKSRCSCLISFFFKNREKIINIFNGMMNIICSYKSTHF